MTLRAYRSSSSFKMAMLFTMLLGVAMIAMVVLMITHSGVLLAHPAILAMFILALLMMLAVIGISFFISIFVVGRINHIAGVAGEIMQTGDLSRRIEVSSHWDDLSSLAGILNNLFARVDELMTGIREVSDNIAHDLRTPLTRMRNQLEALQYQVSADNRCYVERIQAEADRLLGTFRSILQISNIEKGKQRLSFEPVQLDTLLQDVLELYEPLAEERGIYIRTRFKPLWARVDRHLLFQALANVLDNGVKFTPESGTIRVAMRHNTQQAIISIADSGPGVADEHKQQVFKRFYQVAHSRGMPGNGLGLAMVKAVLEWHHGTVELLDHHPHGLLVRISLPLAGAVDR